MQVKPIHHNHSVCLLTYHFIVVCKKRKKELTEQVTIDLFRKAIEKYPITILEGEIGEQNHVHLLIQTSAILSPAQIAKIIKGCTQVVIKQIIPQWEGWSRSYYISTVGGNDFDTVAKYIRNQEKGN